ncbi:MAG: cytochrome c3 family protein [Planctomycetaceae bacterium]|jgi:predicted CXXCH cytochrome family protein|nr:cytochrome c3 family protein [Planctomycetaceae bacterium]
MNQFTSFITENTPIPDPPHLRIIGMIVSAIVMFILVLIILFVVFEASMDMLGSPIQLTDRSHIDLDQEQEEENTLLEQPKAMSFEEMLSRFSILSPLADSCVQGNEVTILCTWDLSDNIAQNVPFSNLSLKVDNMPVLWEVQFGQNTWLTRLRLDPGVHTIQIPGLESRFFVEGSNLQLPENWKTLTMHQDIGNPNHCQECHHLIDRSSDIIRKGHALTIGAWKGNESCLKCHQGESFTKKHLSIAAPETDCRSCHRVHGSVEPEKLLKYPKKDFY